MAPDIRSFFTPKGGQAPVTTPKKAAETPTKGKGRKRRNVVEDDEDDEPAPLKKTTPKAPPKTVKKEEVVETSSYFAGKNKISRTNAPTKKKDVVTKKDSEEEAEDENYLDDDDDDLGDEVYKNEYAKPEDDYVPENKPKTRSSRGKGDEDLVMLDMEDDEEEAKVQAKGRTSRATASSKKRKSLEPDEDDDEEEDDEPAKKKPAPKKPRASKPAAKKEPEDEPEEIKKIHDAIPTVRPPTPPDQDPDRKFNFRDFKQRGNIAPPAQGSKDLPTGAEDCLAGLTFVFTGVLTSLERDVGIELVKRHGGKITVAPSKKTNYVVLGSDAGPRKLQVIRDYGLKTIDEDGLFKLIEALPAYGGSGVAAQKAVQKKDEDMKKVVQAAKEMNFNSTPKPGGKALSKTEAQAQLWTVKYAPTQLKDICGNKAPIDRIHSWLKAWPKNLKTKFQMRGADGSGAHRAVLIHGPPGIGKTTAAHLVAKLEGYDVLEYNASDTRSKKLLEDSLRGVLDNRSLVGYMQNDSAKILKSKQKLILIMDEVDGMSAGDRGGVGQLAALCKKTSIPIICICNDRKAQKMKPFDHVTFDIPFRRPDANAVRARIMSIAFKEGMKIPPQVIDRLTEGTHSDIRQIINMISTFRVTGQDMTFDEGKNMTKAWEKHVVLKPWDIASKLLIGGMFAQSSTKTLNDKAELYFNDHEFSYLMIQENYLKTHPTKASNLSGREARLKLLELTDNAAQSISDGDLVDALIHGTQQHWSLMPTHAMFSTVYPCSQVAGGYAGQMMFTTWLGNNSKYGKLSRYVKEIQSHMRLRSSADRHEVRQYYMPMFFNMLPRRLEFEGKEAVSNIIGLMDDYFLTKDDYDAIIELGLGPMDGARLSIDPATKSYFTRTYNQQSHPMPFMKASSVFAPKKGGKKEQPDLEEAIEESEGELEMLENANKDQAEEEDMDVTKDKYVKQPKKKAAGKSAAAKKGKEKGKAATANDDDDDSEEDKPKGKGKAKAAPKAKGRARK